MASFRAAETSACVAVIPYRSEVERAAARRRPLVLARGLPLARAVARA
jgi:hypothetical protein